MKLYDYKAAYCFKQTQVIIFNTQGQLLDSCDTLIPISQLPQPDLFEVFPVLESLKATLLALVPEETEQVALPRVEFPYKDKYYICDFHFSAIRYQNQPAFLWILQDLTEQYNYLFLVQQERNETIIEAQQLKTENEILALHKDITLLNKLRHIRRNLNTSIISEIEAPLNKIMALTAKLKEAPLGKKEFNYLVSMESAIINIDDQLTQSRPIQLDLFLIPPDRTETNLQDLLWNVLKIFNYQNRIREIPFYLQIKPGLPQTVVVNKPRLAQMFHNFIEFAIFGWNGKSNSLSVAIKELKEAYCRIELVLTSSILPMSKQAINELTEKIEEDINELALMFKGKFNIFVLQDENQVVMTLQITLRTNSASNGSHN